MTDELRLGTLGDEILQAAPSLSLGDAVLQGGITIPVPLQGGITIPVPLPLYGASDDLVILHSGISLPIP